MKRITVLLLALLLLMGTVSAAFTDESRISAAYLDAVTAMSEKGIIGGFEDGTFRPKDTLTRAQAAKILCTMLAGTPAEKADFTDVPATHWAAGFVGWCAEKKIVSGVGGGRFDPAGKLTGCAFAKMLLVAYGHDPEAEGLVGDKWIAGTQKAMRTGGLNTGVTVTEEPIEREMACKMAHNFLQYDAIRTADSAKYKDAALSFRDGKNLKLYGRAEALADGVQLNWPGDAVEFTVDCKGELSLQYQSDESAYYTCFVDGKEYGRRLKTAADGTGVLYQLIAPGTHTIRIVRDSEISTKGKSTLLTGVALSCDAATMQATPRNALYIEAVGASIEAGCGVLGTNKDKWSSEYHAGTKSYVYLAAEQLHADYAIVAKGGIGFDTAANGKTAKDMYGYVNPWRDDTAYSFQRKPDVIICCQGGNDAKTAEDNDQRFVENTIAFAKLLREKNGNVPIVFTYNAMHDKHGEGSVRAWEELGGEAQGYYLLKLERGNHGVPAKEGANGHPDTADQAVNGKLLADYLQTILKAR